MNGASVAHNACACRYEHVMFDSFIVLESLMKKIVCALSLLSVFVSYAAKDNQADKAIASACVACHGAKGISANEQWPNLAAQNALYTQKQLQDYKTGKQRKNAVMTGIVASLTSDDMTRLALFYQQLPAAKGVAKAKDLKRGEALYRGGDLSKGITACIACHGPRGLGNAQAKFPAVSGQHAAYTLTQLNQFKSGQRKNDLNHIMQDIALRMSDQDMAAVANYMQGLH